MNKQDVTLNKCYVAIVLFSAQTSFAANFNFTPVGTLPTTVVSGQTVAANFTLTNMTNSPRNGYSITGLPSTVAQNTTAPNCTNPINLAANASCNLKLDITGAVSSSFAICKGISCTLAATPLNVSISNGPSAPKFAYITNINQAIPYVSLCPLDPTTGAIDSCDNADPNNELYSANGLAGIVLNHAGTIAYMTSVNAGGYVFQCSINQATKRFETCSATYITGYASQYGQLALNHDETIAYIVDYSAFKVLACTMSSGAITNSCVDTGAYAGASGPVQITLSQDDSVAYIGAGYDGVIKCNVSGTTFSPCNVITGDGTLSFDNPTGVALSNDGTKLYVANDVNASKTVYVCSTTMSGANFSSCAIAYNTFAIAPWAITLNESNTVAYINNDSLTDHSNTYTCTISAIDGRFSSCSGSTFAPTPSNTALLY